MFVSGGRDGQLLVWDTRMRPDPIAANDGGNAVGDITGVLVEQGREGIII